MLKHYTLLFCVLFTLLLPKVGTAAEPAIHVCFIAISTPEEKFWGNIIDMARAAAEDLHIDLEVIYAKRNHINAVKLVEEISKRAVKPDYLIVVGEKKIGGKSLAIADKAGIKTILFGTLTPKEQLLYSTPRKKLSHWIGQRAIDDYSLGRQTARAIIDKAFAAGLTDSDGTLNLLGLAGVKATSFSDNRVQGLLDEVAEHQNINLLQVVSTDWTKANSKQICRGLLQRYSHDFAKKVGAIWAANGQIALGVIGAGEEMNMIPGQDFFTSGIDWETEAFTAIKQEKMATVAGGHFAEVAWIMVMLYDYHHGIDFTEDTQTSTPFLLNTQNIDSYLRIFKGGNWQQIDFRRFSKKHYPQIQQYNFSFNAIMEQFQPQPTTLPTP